MDWGGFSRGLKVLTGSRSWTWPSDFTTTFGTLCLDGFLFNLRHACEGTMFSHLYRFSVALKMPVIMQKRGQPGAGTAENAICLSCHPYAISSLLYQEIFNLASPLLWRVCLPRNTLCISHHTLYSLAPTRSCLANLSCYGFVFNYWRQTSEINIDNAVETAVTTQVRQIQRKRKMPGKTREMDTDICVTS